MIKNTFIRGYGALFGFATLAVLARLLTESDFAKYAILTSALAVVTPVFMFGIPTFLIQNAGNRPNIFRYISRQFYLKYTFLAATFFWVFAFFIIYTYPSHNLTVIVVAIFLLIAFVSALVEVIGGYLISQGHASYFQISSFALRPTIIFVPLIFSLFFLGLGLNVFAIGIIYFIAVSCVLFILLIKAKALQSGVNSNINDLKANSCEPAFKDLYLLAILAMSQNFNRQFEVFVSGVIFEDKNTAMFKVLSVFVIFVYSIIAMTNAQNSKVFMQYIEKFDFQGLKLKLKIIEMKMFTLCISFSVAFILLLYFFANDLFAISFDGCTELIIASFVFPLIFSFFSGRGYCLLLMGNQNRLFLNLICGIVISLMLILVISPDKPTTLVLITCFGNLTTILLNMHCFTKQTKLSERIL